MASFLREDSPGAGIAKEVWQHQGGEEGSMGTMKGPVCCQPVHMHSLKSSQTRGRKCHRSRFTDEDPDLTERLRNLQADRLTGHPSPSSFHQTRPSRWTSWRFRLKVISSSLLFISCVTESTTNSTKEQCLRKLCWKHGTGRQEETGARQREPCKARVINSDPVHRSALHMTRERNGRKTYIEL